MVGRSLFNMKILGKSIESWMAVNTGVIAAIIALCLVHNCPTWVWIVGALWFGIQLVSSFWKKGSD